MRFAKNGHKIGLIKFYKKIILYKSLFLVPAKIHDVWSAVELHVTALVAAAPVLTRGLKAAHKSVQMALTRDFRSVPKI